MAVESGVQGGQRPKVSAAAEARMHCRNQLAVLPQAVTPKPARSSWLICQGHIAYAVR